MMRLRGLGETEELARRIARAVNDTYEAIKNDRHANVPLMHKTERIQLPMRLTTEAEYAEAKAAIQKASDEIKKDPKKADSEFRRMKWHERVVERFEAQKSNPNLTYEVEVHVLRIGSSVVCTNPFELFTDYGVQMKARSKATQTFVIQLAGSGSYLPTQRAINGGGYSAVPQSNIVGPQGGQMLVDWTVEAINSMFSRK